MFHKKYIVLNVRGGNYSDQSMVPYKIAVNYINKVIGENYGMQKVSEVIIEGHEADRANRETIIAKGLENVKRTVEQIADVAVC